MLVTRSDQVIKNIFTSCRISSTNSKVPSKNVDFNGIGPLNAQSWTPVSDILRHERKHPCKMNRWIPCPREPPFSGSTLVFHISIAVQTPANSTIKTTPPKFPYEPSAAGKTKTGHNLWRFFQKMRLAGNQSKTDPHLQETLVWQWKPSKNGDLIDLNHPTGV